MNIRLAGAAAAAAALVFAGCGGTDTTTEAADPTPTAEATQEAMETEAAMEEPGTIVEVAASNEDFSTLVAAVEAAGLVETLNGEGPFTVFAPTNEAFEALPPGVLDALLLPENQAVLTQILTYHVVQGAVTSDQITDGEVPTLEGQNITVSTADGVTVNGATVVTADVEASNGVIHVIDTVLLPPGVDPAALVS
jgi:uncharacterized surface protein with fasciclin (FAS1) repeats